jgi:hypothetical protein
MPKQPSSEYRGFRPAGVRLREEMLPQLGRLAAGRSRAMLHAIQRVLAFVYDTDCRSADERDMTRRISAVASC